MKFLGSRLPLSVQMCGLCIVEPWQRTYLGGHTGVDRMDRNWPLSQSQDHRDAWLIPRPDPAAALLSRTWRHNSGMGLLKMPGVAGHDTLRSKVEGHT